MKKTLVFSAIILLLGEFCSSAQVTLSNGKALNFPTKKIGISLGNSCDFTGIRINFEDRNTKVVNGLNVTFWSDDALKFEGWINKATNNTTVNGISIGIIPTAGSMQPICIGLLGIKTSPGNLNGISVGGVGIWSEGNINGISVSGLFTQTNVISGISISGLIVGGTGGIKGLALSGIAVSSDISDIYGVAGTLGLLYCGRNYKGIGIAGIFLRSDTFYGLAIASIANTKRMSGLSIALYNRTTELHGLQFGLLNYAGNNPKGFRILPFINMHLKKNGKSDQEN